jgi:RimJ/RimL family protein N-acetyltransferase
MVLDVARRLGGHRFVHAYPSVDNGPSNAVCRKLGFTLLGSSEVEYPKGAFMLCNDWRLDLTRYQPR